MDRLDAMHILLAALDEGSLAGGARKLSRSPAAVSRAVAGLEGIAGERLLHRSARGMKLTAAGDRHVAIYRQVLGDLDHLAAEADRPQALRGMLRISAPEMFGRLHVLPVVAAFQQRHPDVGVKLFLQNRMTDLVEANIDLALRLADLPDSGLGAVRLGAMPWLMCASPDYVARHGVPDRPADLRHHRCIGRNLWSEGDLWSFNLAGEGRPRIRSIAVPAPLSVSTVAAALDIARNGDGIGQFMAYQVIDDLAVGRLVRLLRRHEVPPFPVHLVFHRGIRPNGVVRAFLDHATPLLRRRIAAIVRPLEAEPRDPG